MAFEEQALAEMISRANELLGDASSYSISTKIPDEWMIEEEKEWDIRLGNESIKNRINRTITEKLGKNYAVEGDVRIIFDFRKNKVTLEKTNLFVFGRYKKHSAGLSQSRWKAPDGTKYYESIEERIGEPFKKAGQADDYVLHASGREDVDATNSAGRAFILEIKNPGIRNIDLKLMEMQIRGDVSVADLRFVKRRMLEFVTESHFDKTYRAEVELGREVTEKDLGKIISMMGKTLLQKTPTRVAHRRADLVRHRKLKQVEIIEYHGTKATISVKAEAGTYIKEMVSGDNGRTEPSIAGELGTSAKCTRLEVTEIDDKFLDFI